MEHGLYVIQGTGGYLLTRPGFPVEAAISNLVYAAFWSAGCIATGR